MEKLQPSQVADLLSEAQEEALRHRFIPVPSSRALDILSRLLASANGKAQDVELDILFVEAWVHDPNSLIGEETTNAFVTACC